jgi:hypothetical protein
MKKTIVLFCFMIPFGLFAGNLGLGLILGSPTGFSGKMLLGNRSAFEMNAGWSFWHHVGIHVTGDYQHLFPGVIHDEYGKPLETVIPYLGIGGRMRIHDTDDNGGDTDFAVGIRMGGGIEYMLDKIGIFLELYPVVNVIPATDFDFEGGLGARYYF